MSNLVDKAKPHAFVPDGHATAPEPFCMLCGNLVTSPIHQVKSASNFPHVTVSEMLEWQKTANANSPLFRVIATYLELLSRAPTLMKLKPGEPIFVLRAQDKIAGRTIQYWSNQARSVGSPRHKIDDAFDKWKKFTHWEGSQKVPD